MQQGAKERRQGARVHEASTQGLVRKKVVPNPSDHRAPSHEVLAGLFTQATQAAGRRGRRSRTQGVKQVRASGGPPRLQHPEGGGHRRAAAPSPFRGSKARPAKREARVDHRGSRPQTGDVRRATTEAAARKRKASAGRTPAFRPPGPVEQDPQDMDSGSEGRAFQQGPFASRVGEPPAAEGPVTRPAPEPPLVEAEPVPLVDGTGRPPEAGPVRSARRRSVQPP